MRIQSFNAPMGVDLLPLLKPILRFMPGVPKPPHDVPLRVRLRCTGLAVVLYLTCSHLPLYGVRKILGDDPSLHLDVMTARSKYTLMEFGFNPLFASGMILQALVSMNFLNRNTPEPLFRAVEKLATLVFTVFQTTAMLVSGVYGSFEDLGQFRVWCIAGQLFGNSVALLLLNDLLRNGYGISTGANVFIATNICEQILWDMFSPKCHQYARGPEYHGAFIACVDMLFRYKDKRRALFEAFFRCHLPNMANVVSTIFLIGAIVYLEQIKVSVGLSALYNRSIPQPLKLKLFYTSTTPIMLQNMIIAGISAFSEMMNTNYPYSRITKLIGGWESLNIGGGIRYQAPVSGLVYYLRAPKSLAQTLNDPVHTLVYFVICIVSAGVLAYYYQNINGASAPDIIRWMQKNQVALSGHRGEDHKAIQTRLNQVIPVLAALGGMLTGMLACIADFLGAFGTGSGILVAASIVTETMTDIKKEFRKTGRSYPF